MGALEVEVWAVVDAAGCVADVKPSRAEAERRRTFLLGLVSQRRGGKFHEWRGRGFVAPFVVVPCTGYLERA